MTKLYEWIIFGGTLGLIGIAIVLMFSTGPVPERKNRVPSMGMVTVNEQDLANLKQQLKDTQAAAAQAQQASAIALLAAQRIKDAQPKSDPSGREMSGSGIITDFGMYTQVSGQVDDYYIGFTMTEKSGFTKRFFPVCPGQTIKAGL